MISPEQNKRAMENLIAKANAETGKNDTTITAVVDSLIEGQGSDIPVWGKDFDVTGLITEKEQPLAYHLTSIDDLPKDAVDGSLAVVESPHKVLGAWQFNETISMPFADWLIEFRLMSGGDFEELAGYGNLQYRMTSGEGQTVYTQGAWINDAYKYIEITGIDVATNVNTLATWLRANGEQLVAGVGHELYSRENGEWVNKGEYK